MEYDSKEILRILEKLRRGKVGEGDEEMEERIKNLLSRSKIKGIKSVRISHELKTGKAMNPNIEKKYSALEKVWKRINRRNQ